MLRRPYLGIGEATKRQAVAAWNALPSKRRHFVAIDGQSRQRTEQNHGVEQKLTSSRPPRYEEQPLPIGRLLGRNGFKCSARADGFIWLVGFVLGIGIRAFS
jgi:hypothetical protein